MEGGSLIMSLTKRAEELETWIAELVKWTKYPRRGTSPGTDDAADDKTGEEEKKPSADYSDDPRLIVIKDEPASPQRQRQSQSPSQDVGDEDSLSLTLPSPFIVDVDMDLTTMNNDDDDEEYVPPKALDDDDHSSSDIDCNEEEDDDDEAGPKRRKRMKCSSGRKLTKAENEETEDPGDGGQEAVEVTFSWTKQDDDCYSPPKQKRPVDDTEPPARRGRGRPRKTSLNPKPIVKRSSKRPGVKTKIISKRLSPITVPPASTTSFMDPTVKMTRLLQDEMSDLGIDLVMIPVDLKKYEKTRFVTTRCKICRINFKLEIQLKAHLKKAHGLNRKPCSGIARTCPTCGKVLYHNQKYLEHLTVHSDERPCQCDVCGTGFKYKKALRMHKEAMHSGLKRPVFTCEKCGMSFFLKASFERHNLKEHSEGGVNILAVKCGICGLVVKDKDILRRHTRDIHEGSQSHSCHLCGRIFIQRHSLNRHLKTVDHEKRKRKEKPYYKMHQGPLKCPICGIPFTNKNNMEKHISRHVNPEAHPLGRLKQAKQWIREDEEAPQGPSLNSNQGDTAEEVQRSPLDDQPTKAEPEESIIVGI